MRRLAAFLSAFEHREPDRAALLAACLGQDPAAARLLTGPAPRALIPLATLRDWVAAETGLPDWLIDASRRATGDLAEALALILPAAQTPEPDLAEVLADLAALPPGPLAKSAILTMARRLPPEPRVLYFRLVTGTFRPAVTAALLAEAQRRIAGEAPANAPLHHILAVMIYAQAALTTGARGPEITLAVWDDGHLIPITRARANLPAPQTASLMTWIRSTATGRFGPLRAVPAQQVFRLGFTTLAPNRRRKSGIILTNPRILDWLPDLSPSEAAQLTTLTALLPNTA